MRDFITKIKFFTKSLIQIRPAEFKFSQFTNLAIAEQQNIKIKISPIQVNQVAYWTMTRVYTVP